MTARTGLSEPWRVSAVLRRSRGAGVKLAALTVAQGAIYAFPIVFAVVCARTLGPSQYGVVAFYTALTSFLCMFIEFGFDSIGVREVNADPSRRHAQEVIWNVTLAKLAICVPTAALTAVAVLATQGFASLSIVFAMTLYMVAFSLESAWYLRALERMRSVMVVALVSRMAGIALLVATVKSPDDVPLAMWAYTFVAWMSAAVGWWTMRRHGVLGLPRYDRVRLRSLFKSGASVVFGNLSGYSVTTAGIAVLGAIADPVVTGAANLALRIRAAGVATFVPLSQMGFVRLSALVGIDPGAAVELGRRLFYMLMAWTLVLSLAIGLEADRIAALAYGLPKAPEAASTMLRLVALGMPACVAGTLFGVQGLTLFRQERAYVLVSMGAAILFFGLLFSLEVGDSARYGWALLAADVWTALVAGLALRQTVRRRGRA